MAEKADETAMRYHRRLDRTPEKHFERLPDGEKKLISAMRGALENCRNKVTEMKDEITEKEKTIEEEKSRRKEAEKRLRQYLVDPYGSPEVNSELRNRLPRASKTDPLLDSKEVAQSSEESEAEEEVVAKSKASRNNAGSSHSPGGGKHSKKRVRRVLNFEPPTKSSNQSHPGHDFESEDNQSEPEEEDVDDVHHHRKPSNRHRRGKIKSQSPPPLPYHPADPSPFTPFRYPHYAPGNYPVGPYPTPMYSPFSLTPWSSMSSVGFVPPVYGPRYGQTTASRPGIPLSRSCPLLNGEQVGTLGADAGLFEDPRKKMPPATTTNTASVPSYKPASPQTIPSTDGTIQASAGPDLQGSAAQDSALSPEHNPAAQKSAIPMELFSQSTSSMASSHYALPSSLPRESGVQGGIEERYRSMFPQAGVGGHSVPLVNISGSGSLRDLSARQTSLLQEEVGRLRDANQELAEKLAVCTREVETLKLQILTETPKDGSLDTDAARKLADFMAEIKIAEKRREETMGARARQAEQDREELTRDLERALLRTATEKGSGRHLTMKDLSSASETEDSEDEEEEELELTKRMKGEHPVPSAPGSSDAGRVTSLKDALKELERRQETEHHIYQEEMQVVMEQRDQALELLQAERERTQLHQLHSRTQREQMLLAKITALQREKDRAENAALQLKDELVDRNLYISLHKALFADSALNSYDKTDPHPANSKLKEKVDGEEDVEEGPVEMKEDNQLLEQLRQANQERSLLKTRCEELEALCKQEKEEKNRLERLNGVLRRKLIAVSSSGSQNSQDE